MLTKRPFSTTATLTRVSALALLMTGNFAFAKQCDEPFAEPIADAYWDLEKPRLDRETYTDLNKLANKLDGRWHGTAIEVNCRVSNGTPLATIENYDLDADIEQHFQGAIIVRAEKESREKVQLENLFIAPEIEREIEKLNQGATNGLPSYTIEFATPNTVIFDHKYRASNVVPPINNLTYWVGSNSSIRTNSSDRNILAATPGAAPGVNRARRLVHEIKTVSLDNAHLTINRDVYVNGIFVSQQEWKLKKY